jgi:hypothetical protein
MNSVTELLLAKTRAGIDTVLGGAPGGPNPKLLQFLVDGLALRIECEELDDLAKAAFGEIMQELRARDPEHVLIDGRHLDRIREDLEERGRKLQELMLRGPEHVPMSEKLATMKLLLSQPPQQEKPPEEMTSDEIRAAVDELRREAAARGVAISEAEIESWGDDLFGDNDPLDEDDDE